MIDPRMPITTKKYGGNDSEIIHEILYNATAIGVASLSCSAVSFVIAGTSHWLEEMRGLDAKATSQMLAALAVIYDPKANDAKKQHAERKRYAAASKLFHLADLANADKTGNA